MPTRREIDLVSVSPVRAGVALTPPLTPALSLSGPLPLVPGEDWRARARSAACAELAARGAAVDPSRIVLAAGRAQAYALLFSALGGAHDELLAPAPYEPRAARVARTLGLHVSHAPAGPDLAPDLGALHDAIGERTRAIVIGAPAAGSGAMPTREHVEALAALGLPLVSDETFAQTRLEAGGDRLSSVLAAGPPESLTLAIGGLDGAGLPEAQLAWIAAAGPDHAVEDALDRLNELVDALDAVSAPIAHALPEILAAAPRAEIAARCGRNLAALRALGLEVPTVDGGFSACVRMPDGRTDDAWAHALLEAGVRVHPGSLFGLDPDDAWIALALSAPEDDFDGGLQAIAQIALRAR